MKAEKYLYKISPDKIKLGLERTEKLLRACNNPEKSFFSIQIVGTNGKGSTAALLSNVFQTRYKVGLFTSPHLVDYKERIRINFQKIQTHEVDMFLEKHKQYIYEIKPSFFEIMTVMAMWYFKKNNVDIAILETGLGGRLDSVTACQNSIVAFTNIDLDHQTILGNTIEEIALEKAAAITAKTQMIFSVKQHKNVQKIISKQAKPYNLSIEITNTKIKSLKLKHLYGPHQIINAQLAYQISKTISKNYFINIKSNDIINGIKTAKWPGRFHIINTKPTVVFDVAHNNAAIASLIKTLNVFLVSHNFNKKTLICAFEDNKKINYHIQALGKFFDSIICTETNIKKSMNCQKLAQKFNNSKTTYNKNIKEVFTLASGQNKKNHFICILGSHYFGPHISKIYNKSFAKI